MLPLFCVMASGLPISGAVKGPRFVKSTKPTMSQSTIPHYH